MLANLGQFNKIEELITGGQIQKSIKTIISGGCSGMYFPRRN
ncbi:Uncharacterized protein dnm_004370 [Desulfonema magnum]|uniref:Uncharacterized protein n=1 Tax=Desulfonema magnum TaxID=45655 RepID=A0A975BFJ7_9BACT|nr:Uncharacterized protein dnm_004370 [Desulfonema magnum]